MRMYPSYIGLLFDLTYLVSTVHVALHWQRRALTAAERACYLPSELRHYEGTSWATLESIPLEPLPAECEWA